LNCQFFSFILPQHKPSTSPPGTAAPRSHPVFRTMRVVVRNLDTMRTAVIVQRGYDTTEQFFARCAIKFAIPVGSLALRRDTVSVVGSPDLTLHQCFIFDNTTVHVADTRSLSLFVNVSSGCTLPLTVCPSVSVGVLRTRVAKMLGCPVSRCGLAFGVWALLDGYRLEEYGVPNEGSLLFRLGALRGGSSAGAPPCQICAGVMHAPAVLGCCNQVLCSECYRRCVGCPFCRVGAPPPAPPAPPLSPSTVWSDFSDDEVTHSSDEDSQATTLRWEFEDLSINDTELEADTVEVNQVRSSRGLAPVSLVRCADVGLPPRDISDVRAMLGLGSRSEEPPSRRRRLTAVSSSEEDVVMQSPTEEEDEAPAPPQQPPTQEELRQMPGSFQIFIRALDNSTVSLWVRSSTVVLSIKGWLLNRLGWFLSQPRDLRLVFGTRELHDMLSVGFYNIHEACTLVMLLRYRGGAGSDDGDMSLSEDGGGGAGLFPAMGVAADDGDEEEDMSLSEEPMEAPAAAAVPVPAAMAGAVHGGGGVFQLPAVAGHTLEYIRANTKVAGATGHLFVLPALRVIATPNVNFTLFNGLKNEDFFQEHASVATFARNRWVVFEFFGPQHVENMIAQLRALSCDLYGVGHIQGNQMTAICRRSVTRQFAITGGIELGTMMTLKCGIRTLLQDRIIQMVRAWGGLCQSIQCNFDIESMVKPTMDSVLLEWSEMSACEILTEVGSAKCKEKKQRTTREAFIVSCKTELLAALRSKDEVPSSSLRFDAQDASLPSLSDVQPTPSQLQLRSINIATGAIVTVSLRDWVMGGLFGEKSLVIHGAAACCKTPVAKSVVAYIACALQSADSGEAFYLKVGTADSLRAATRDGLMRPGVPILFDEVTPSVARGSRCAMSAEDVKHMTEAADSSALDGRNSDIVFAYPQPKVFTSNASEPWEWFSELPRGVWGFSDAQRLGMSANVLALFKRVYFMHVTAPLLSPAAIAAFQAQARASLGLRMANAGGVPLP
jgi:hypothetical protein